MKADNKKILVGGALVLLLLLAMPANAAGSNTSAEDFVIDQEVENGDPLLSAEPDAKGYYQIGFGSIYNYDAGRNVRPGDTITSDTAYRWLRIEIGKVSDWLDSHVTVPLSNNEKTALISLGYNIGTGQEGLGGSTLIKLLNSGADKETVADQFQWWRLKDGQISPGLVARREREKQLFLS